jgi:hypothetical protein
MALSEALSDVGGKELITQLELPSTLQSNNNYIKTRMK